MPLHSLLFAAGVVRKLFIDVHMQKNFSTPSHMETHSLCLAR